MPNIEQRISRLENETESIYELIDEFRAESAARFAQIDRRFEQVDRRFDQMDARFDQMDARFEQIDGQLAEVIRRLPSQ